MHPFFAQEHPIAFSHRGGALLWPENTLEAFQRSYELGYRFFETDLHLTRDGLLVLFHDDTLERTTDGTGLVIDRTMRDLEALDAGYWFGPEHGYPYRGKGITIPALEDVLRAFPDCYFTLELKHGDAEAPLGDVIRRLDAWDRLIVGGYRDSWLWRFRQETGGRVATSTGRWEIGAFWMLSRVRRGLRLAAVALQVPPVHKGLTVLDEPFVRAVHAVGKQVHAWTIDSALEINRMLDLGVDGIMTDRPDILKDVLIERGRGGPWNA
jgi:glycerophosphoryl diester phosphodiesterase